MLTPDNRNYHVGASITRRVKSLLQPLPGWIAVAVLMLLPGLLHAQLYNNTGIMQNPVLKTPRDYEGRYFNVGSFALRPLLNVATEWHDNIYYQNENQSSDTVAHFQPGLELTSSWSRHALTLGARGDIARFKDYSTEDYEDIVLDLNAQIDVKTGKYFTVETGSAKLHEDRSSPEDVDGIQPTQFDTNSLGFGYHHRFNRLTAALTLDKVDLSYDNNFNQDGELIDNVYRDRSLDSYNLRLDYLVMPQRSVFLDFGRNEVTYDRAIDDAGFARGSDGFSLRGGMVFDISGVLTGELWLQYLDQTYDDPRFSDNDDTGFGMGLEWSPTRLTQVSFRGSSNVLETTQKFASGYVSKLYSVRLQHEFRRWLLFHATASVSDNDYALTPGAPPEALSNSRPKTVGLGLSYLFNQHFNLTGGYSIAKQTANLAVDEYRAKRVFLVLAVQF
jgi:hypothetical protein